MLYYTSNQLHFTSPFPCFYLLTTATAKHPSGLLKSGKPHRNRVDRMIVNMAQASTSTLHFHLAMI